MLAPGFPALRTKRLTYGNSSKAFTMTQDTANATPGNIIDSIEQAFGQHGFYGLEYVLDEWQQNPPQMTASHFPDTDPYLDFLD